MKSERNVDVEVYIFEDRIEIWTRIGMRRFGWWKNVIKRYGCLYERGYHVCKPHDIYDFLSALIMFFHRWNLSARIINAKTKEVVHVV